MKKTEKGFVLVPWQDVKALETETNIMCDALRAIVAWPVDGNSKPNVMASAIDAMQSLAYAALNKGKKR
jgi:hypothetical protein